VPALSDLPLEIHFQPKHEVKYNYNLTCNVKRKARPLILNVKGEGYKIHHTVFADEPRREAKAGEPFNLDFGEFFINEKKSKTVVLTNSGDFNFDFVWKRQVNKYIKITPETGTVTKGGEVEIQIDYAPISEHQLKNFKMMLTIVSGPKYDFVLQGKARKPGVKLNSHVFDFGPCFVTPQPAPIKKILEITNLDAQAISLESDFEKKPYLDFPVVPGQVLMPDSAAKLEIPIVFTPREIRKYSETIKLDFNGLYFVDIQVIGQGIHLNLDLKDPDQLDTDLGIVSVGGDVSRTVPVINRSAKSVKFRVEPLNSETFAKSALSLKPSGTEVVLKPKEVLPLEVRFKPKTRMPDFEHDIMIDVEGVEEKRKLLSVKGVAHGIELKIMDEILAFGNVVKDSRLTKTLQMSNFGDVKANFAWDTKNFSKNFTISPDKGYVNPNSNLDLEVTFHPKTVDPDLR
jgi:hydrocephalus-inducing protein